MSRVIRIVGLSLLALFLGVSYSFPAYAEEITIEQDVIVNVPDKSIKGGGGGGAGATGSKGDVGVPSTGTFFGIDASTMTSTATIITISIAAVGIVSIIFFSRKSRAKGKSVLTIIATIGLCGVIVFSAAKPLGAAAGDLAIVLDNDTLTYTLNPGESASFGFASTVYTSPDSYSFEVVASSNNTDPTIALTLSGDGLDNNLLLGSTPVLVRSVDSHAAAGHTANYTLEVAVDSSIAPGSYTIELSHTVNTVEPVLHTDQPVEKCLNNQSSTNIKVNLNDNMIPVRYNEDLREWVKADRRNKDQQNKWYDYDHQVWANAVTVKEAGVNSRQYYLDAPLGEVIPEGDILTFMVYIPRFMYSIDGSNAFAGGTQNTPGCIDIFFVRDTVTKESGTASYTSAQPENWRTHPAFTFGDEELAGLWVSKFTVTTDPDSLCYTTPNATNCNTPSLTPRVKPNDKMWVFVNYANPFTASQNMNLAGNIYGYDTSADVHMMKNSEWGAITYLSQSVFGKYGNPTYTSTNKQVYMNKDGFPLRAGMSNGTPSQATTNTQCPYDDITDRGSGTGACGAGASTTGNISGVYDMSGGAWAYVMGVHTNQPRSSGFLATWFTDPANAKYYDYYATTSAATACNGGPCYGHALSETSTWYGDRDFWITTSAAWMMRGGYNTYAPQSGIFAYSSTSVVIDNVHGFRIVHP